MKQRSSKYEEGRELVRRWRASGMSQGEFCRATGIPVSRVHYWRQRVTEDDQAPPKPAPQFIAVQVRPPATSEGIEVVLTNGRVVRVRGAVDYDLLQQVLVAAEARC